MNCKKILVPSLFYFLTFLPYKFAFYMLKMGTFLTMFCYRAMCERVRFSFFYENDKTDVAFVSLLLWGEISLLEPC